MTFPFTLNKPLLFFDLETTGINTQKDKIVEIYCRKIEIDGTEKTYHSLINPGIPIPAETTAIHGITDEKVKDSPSFKDIANELYHFFGNSDIAGFNSNKFDVPLLNEEFYRAEINFDLDNRKFVDVQRIFHMMEPRNLSAAYKFYCQKDLENAHEAKADVDATYEIFLSQLNKYEQLEKNVEALHEYTGQNNMVDISGRIVLDAKKQEVFNFGKYKGQTVESVFTKDLGYYDWMMKGDFAAHTKQVITRIKLRKFNKN